MKVPTNPHERDEFFKKMVEKFLDGHEDLLRRTPTSEDIAQERRSMFEAIDGGLSKKPGFPASN
jgi:hypothetical protein